MEDGLRKKKKIAKVRFGETMTSTKESQIEDEVIEMPDIDFEDADYISAKRSSGNINTKWKSLLRSKWLYALLILIIYIVLRSVTSLNISSENSAKQEMQSIVKGVGRLIELPDAEDPTIATVSNLEALKNQPFFANAKVGDKVLIYAKSHKAILYRPDINKLIEVAPFGFNNTPANIQKYN